MVANSVDAQSIGEVVHYYQIVYYCLISFRVRLRVVMKQNEHLKSVLKTYDCYTDDHTVPLL